MAGVEGSVAIVTGAGRGLGRSHALRLASGGARVVVNDTGVDRSGIADDAGAAHAVVREIEAAGGHAVADLHDVGSEDGAVGVVRTALDTWGRVDVVVNNAGILRDTTFHKMTTAQWDDVRRVHLDATAYVTRAAWPQLREQRYGRVVVTTSGAGLFGNFGQANYAAAKLGVVGFMLTLALEAEKYGIRINAVAPVALTRMTAGLLDAAADLDPAWVSAAVAWLCGEGCPVTGEIVRINGPHISRVRILESAGVDFETPPTEDELDARWQRIADLSAVREGRAAVAEARAAR